MDDMEMSKCLFDMLTTHERYHFLTCKVGFWKFSVGVRSSDMGSEVPLLLS
jgi:hypothetical protein